MDGTEIPASSGKDIPVLKGVQRAVWGAGWQIWQAWGDWLVGKFHRFIYIIGCNCNQMIILNQWYTYCIKNNWKFMHVCASR